MSHEYDLTLTTEKPTDLTIDTISALHEVGCRDAIVRMGDGQIWLLFTRTAESWEEAVRSAIEDAAKAGVKAKHSMYARIT